MKKRLLCLLSVLLVLLALVPAHPAHASTTWTVTNTGDDGTAQLANCPGDGTTCRLRDAIAGATADGPGDTINITATGTITLASPLLISGLGGLTINGPGSASLAVDGNHAGRVFYLFNSTVSMSGLTVQNGLVNAVNTDLGSNFGGGIAVVGTSHLTLDHVAVSHNTVDCSGTCTPNASHGLGGGISVGQGGSLAMTQSAVTNNSATDDGGGIYFGSDTSAGDSLTLTNVEVSHNQVTDTSTGDGGGLYVGHGYTINLDYVNAHDNSAAEEGGAFYLNGTATSTPSINHSVFDLNQQTDVNGLGGAAITVFGASPLAVGNSVIYSNTAQAGGGGISSWSGSVLVYNSTLTGNTGYRGGGVYTNTGTAFFQNDTLSSNTTSAGNGGALFSLASTLYLENTILAKSIGGSDCSSDTAWTVNVNNLLQTNDVSHPCGSVYKMGLDPMLGPLQDNGGPTLTLALLPGSPAIDEGSNSVCSTAATINNQDQRGRPRPVDADLSGAILCDMGAYEAGIFADVPVTGKEWMEPWIDAFAEAHITTGCGTNPLIYCPESSTTRAAMAVFLLRAIHGANYTPPAATGIFADVPVAGKEWMQPWIEEFYNEGITTGCGTNPLIFCPEASVTRAAMAVFVLRATQGSGYTPPAATGIFADVPVSGKEWMQPWIEEFYNEGITTGCGTAPLSYCPETATTRAAMAVFIDRAFGLHP